LRSYPALDRLLEREDQLAYVFDIEDDERVIVGPSMLPDNHLAARVGVDGGLWLLFDANRVAGPVEF
jgi:hypothetical protein